MSDKIFYYLYKTTNLINNKFYIGIHQTKNLDDIYLGSGKYLCNAIKKYGKENFKKEILFYFDNEQDMINKEIEIVNEDFLQNPDVYNIVEGGFGGYSVGKLGFDAQEEKHGPDWRKIINKKATKALKEKYGPDWQKLNKQKALSPESRSKRLATFKRNKHAQGSNNSQYGTMWIYNPETNHNMKIKKDEPIPEGYIKGRKC